MFKLLVVGLGILLLIKLIKTDKLKQLASTVIDIWDRIVSFLLILVAIWVVIQIGKLIVEGI